MPPNIEPVPVPISAAIKTVAVTRLGISRQALDTSTHLVADSGGGLATWAQDNATTGRLGAVMTRNGGTLTEFYRLVIQAAKEMQSAGLQEGYTETNDPAIVAVVRRVLPSCRVEELLWDTKKAPVKWRLTIAADVCIDELTVAVQTGRV